MRPRSLWLHRADCRPAHVDCPPRRMLGQPATSSWPFWRRCLLACSSRLRPLGDWSCFCKYIVIFILRTLLTHSVVTKYYSRTSTSIHTLTLLSSFTNVLAPTLAKHGAIEKSIHLLYRYCIVLICRCYFLRLGNKHKMSTATKRNMHQTNFHPKHTTHTPKERTEESLWRCHLFLGLCHQGHRFLLVVAHAAVSSAATDSILEHWRKGNNGVTKQFLDDVNEGKTTQIYRQISIGARRTTTIENEKRRAVRLGFGLYVYVACVCA